MFDETHKLINHIDTLLKKPVNKTALIFGITGQDGYYLAAHLLSLNYNVVGVHRRSSVDSHLDRLSTLPTKPALTLVEGDLTDSSSVRQIIDEVQADEIYNLAAQSHVHTSFQQPDLTFQVNTIGVLNILEAIRAHSPFSRFYQASTSEMFGNSQPFVIRVSQNEETEFAPSSPYAIAKVAAHNLCNLYRQSYDMFICCGILFNHESPVRGKNFVTKKITRYVAALHSHQYNNEAKPVFVDTASMSGFAISSGFPVVQYYNSKEWPKLRLGNLDSKRDWGYAGDYVSGMHLMLQQDDPDDYVLATGKTHSVREFLDEAFGSIGIEDWSQYVEIDPAFYRPCDVQYLLGDASKAKEVLGWEPNVTFKELVVKMVESDMYDKVRFEDL